MGQAAGQGNDSLEIGLRLEWGGPGPTQWQVRIDSPDGAVLSEPRRLAMTPDTPGAWQVDAEQFVLYQLSPRTYDGLQFRVAGPATARLRITANHATLREPLVLQRTLQQFQDEVQSIPLPNRVGDASDGMLRVQRAPGDRLRVQLREPSRVHSPGDTLSLACEVRRGGLEPGGYRLRATLQAARGGTVQWQDELEVTIDDAGDSAAVDIDVPLPQAEGAYDLNLAVVRRRLPAPFARTTTLLQRNVQCVVVADEAAAASDAAWRVLAEIDPTRPPEEGWINRLTGLRFWFADEEPESFGEGAETVSLEGQSWTRLAPGGWRAMPLPITEVDRPHLVEVDLPRNPQSLTTVILEADADGGYSPSATEAGVDVHDPLPVATNPAPRQRLAHWPRSKAPMLLLSNPSSAPAYFGQIRVHAGPERLASSPGPPVAEERLAAVFLNQPQLGDLFAGALAADEGRGAAFDDWRNFHQGGRRLAEYLHYAGYNAAVLSVVRQGGSLYPSRLLQPTPRYDGGVFFLNGQDPEPKDVLEMTFRIFDAEGLKLAPALHFSGSLPALEAVRQTGRQAEGVRLMGPGERFRMHPNGVAAYNPLDPRVRRAISDIVAELVQRYGHHESFAGVCLQLSPDTCLQLPGELWGVDAATFDRFLQETGSRAKAGTVDERVALVRGQLRDAWLQWRAAQISSWYAEMQQEIAAVAPAARLILDASEGFQAPELQTHLIPRLRTAMDVQAAALSAGLDLPALNRQKGVVVLRPYRLGDPLDLGLQAISYAAARSAEMDEHFAAGAATRGTVLVHEPRAQLLRSFPRHSAGQVRAGPLDIQPQFLPAGPAARRWLCHSLAVQDPAVWLIGGALPALGQEAEMRDLLLLFRRLPRGDFSPVKPRSGDTGTQPLMVLQAVQGRTTYSLLVNDSPWPLQVTLTWKAPREALLEAVDGRPVADLEFGVGGATWKTTLAPYDARAVKIASPDAGVTDWRVDNVEQHVPQLKILTRNVLARANSVTPRSLQVLADPGFESGAGTRLDHWRAGVRGEGEAAPEQAAARDASVVHSGKSSLHLRSTGGDVWVRSEPFEPPTTRRLYVQVALRVADPSRQPQLRIALDDDRDFYAYVPLGAGSQAERIHDDFSRSYLVAFDHIPAEVQRLEIGFDLIGEGEIWIDDVRLYDLWFDTHDLSKLINTAALVDMGLLKKNKVGGAFEFLDDYWSQFLMRHVPLEQTPQVASSGDARRSELTSPAADGQDGRDEQDAAAPQRKSAWQRVRELVPIRR